MKILAFDLAIRTGWACGAAGEIPVSSALRLIKPTEPIEALPFAVAKLTRDKILEYRPDVIVRESWLDPYVQPSSQATITQLLAHGAMLSIAGLYGITVHDVPVQTWRKHFTGRSTANKRSKVPRSNAEKAADRKANKEFVAARAALLGYVPKGCEDFDRCDALGIWSYGISEYDLKLPTKLYMFGEEAGAR